MQTFNFGNIVEAECGTSKVPGTFGLTHDWTVINWADGTGAYIEYAGDTIYRIEGEMAERCNVELSQCDGEYCYNLYIDDIGPQARAIPFEGEVCDSFRHVNMPDLTFCSMDCLDAATEPDCREEIPTAAERNFGMGKNWGKL